MNANQQPHVMRDGEIIPPELAVKAMRDSGYKNTAYALAELIDNAVQANASRVEVLCIEERVQVGARERRRIKDIGIFDDGVGMDPETLRLALQFGNGTHLNDRKGIGRFGMGLPNASISQCRRVDIWSWQSGPDNAMHTYLDVDKIETGELLKVPEPTHQPVPSEWKGRIKNYRTTGTLVLWSNFDEHRLTWKGARATLHHTEFLVGRMYRKYIHEGKVVIRLAAMEGSTILSDKSTEINDPLYLMKESTTPPPYNKRPMFTLWGEETFEIELNGAKHQVVVRGSYANPDTIPTDGTDRGHKEYGKHAARNVGISILRAGRELELDGGWTNTYDPRERWWGIEVEFPPALDEIFGVPNNKQAANLFSQMAHFNWRDEANEGESFMDLKRRLAEDHDPRALLMEITAYIQDKALKTLRKLIEDQGKGLRKGSKRYDTSVEDLATTKFNERAEQGHKTEQDGKQFDDAAQKALVKDLVDTKQYSERVAQEIADAVVRRNRRVIFVDADFDGYAFFKIDQKPGGITEVVFNKQHPAYVQLMRVLDIEGIENVTEKELLSRVQTASDTVRMLFAAWARYEMEDVANRQRIDDIRQEWGRMARDFLMMPET